MEMNVICRIVARTLMSEIGPWGERCALFGGIVPGLLVPETEGTLAPHIGTQDIDLALRIAALSDDQETCAGLFRLAPDHPPAFRAGL